jgi:uncharacterized iron-regulated membrane protein
MKVYKLFWDTHKWVGIALSVVFFNMAVTGMLLLVKKKYDWIQPPTREGAAGSPEDFITNQQLFETVLSLGHEDFLSIEDIDRVDFRPGKRVHKVHSVHNYSEIQVDAVTGAVLNNEMRVSDMLEKIHDGSFFGTWVHDWFMPMAAFCLFFLTGSGLYLWAAPLIRKNVINGLLNNKSRSKNQEAGRG